MKKTLALLLTLVMLLGMIPMSALAVETDTAILSFEHDVDDVSALKAGDTFTVTATLTNNPGFAALQFDLEWDNTVVQFNGFSTKEIAELGITLLDSQVIANAEQYNQETGVIVVGKADDITTSGKLFVANFTVLKEGDAAITFKKDFPDFEMKHTDQSDVDLTVDETALEELVIGKVNTNNSYVPKEANVISEGIPAFAEDYITIDKITVSGWNVNVLSYSWEGDNLNVVLDDTAAADVTMKVKWTITATNTAEGATDNHFNLQYGRSSTVMKSSATSGTIEKEYSFTLENGVLTAEATFDNCTRTGSSHSEDKHLVITPKTITTNFAIETPEPEEHVHDYEAVVTPPTCTEGGYTTYTCKDGDDSYVAERIPATGHTPGEEPGKCATCGEAMTIIPEGAPFLDMMTSDGKPVIITEIGMDPQYGFGPLYKVEVPAGTTQVNVTYKEGDVYVDDFGYATTYVFDDPSGYVTEDGYGQTTSGGKTIVGLQMEKAKANGSGTNYLLNIPYPEDEYELVYAGLIKNPGTMENFHSFAFTYKLEEGQYFANLPKSFMYTVSGDGIASNGYTFTVSIKNGYEATEEFAIRVNGEVVATQPGEVTVASVTEDIFVTVEGVDKIYNAETDYSITVDLTEYTGDIDGELWLNKRNSETYVIKLVPGKKNTITVAASEIWQFFANINSISSDVTGYYIDGELREGGGYLSYGCNFRDAQPGKHVIKPITEHIHDYEAVVTPPTCTEGGYTTYTCKDGDDSYVAERTPATGHTPNPDNKAECKDCGIALTVIPEGAKFIEMVTDKGEAVNIIEKDGHYLVEVPYGTMSLLVTYPDDVPSVDGFGYVTTRMRGFDGVSDDGYGKTTKDGKITVGLVLEKAPANGAPTVLRLINLEYPTVKKTVGIVMKDGSVETFALTYMLDEGEYFAILPVPEDCVGYTVSGSSIAKDGYSFTVALAEGYQADSNFAVKVNGETVATAPGTITLETVSGNITVTVEGVSKAQDNTTDVIFNVDLTAAPSGMTGDIMIQDKNYNFVEESVASGKKSTAAITAKNHEYSKVRVYGVDESLITGWEVNGTVYPAGGKQYVGDLTIWNRGYYLQVEYNGTTPITINVKPVMPEPTAEGYTVEMPADKTVVAGENVEIPVVVNHADGSQYNAFDMSFTYDASVLELTSTEIEGMTVEAANGTVHVVRYGDALSAGTAAVTLKFKAIGNGTANVVVTSAKVDIAENAAEFDAPEATLSDDTTVVTVSGYSVTLPEEFKGDATVMPGADYTFEANDKNYNYTFDGSTMGGQDVEVKDNGNGTFTVEDVNGTIVIKTEKTGKKFDVTLGDDMEGAEEAQYMTDYTATLTKEDGFGYTITVTIGGADYTGFAYDEETGVVTIPGEAITGEIVFDSAKTAGEFTVTFEGNGAGDATGEAVAEGGKEYSFTLTKAAGFEYTVSAKMGDKDIELTEEDGTYTIAKVTGNIVVTIEKTSDLAVEVSQYVELDGKTIFLVRATQTLAEGKALAYDGTVMYYSEQYGAWAYLVVVGEGETFTADDAKAKITEAEAEFTKLTATFDVNMTNVVDVNDAQLVYNIYNCEYDEIVDMQKFLNADVNGDKVVDVLDAAAVINSII